MNNGKEPLAGAWAGVVIAYLIMAPMTQLPTFFKIIGFVCAMLGGAKVIQNWNQHNMKCYPIIGAGLVVSALGAWFGGFPNVFVVTDIPIFEINGATFVGYWVYLVIFSTWLAISYFIQKRSIHKAETTAILDGAPGMKRMLI